MFPGDRPVSERARLDTGNGTPQTAGLALAAPQRSRGLPAAYYHRTTDPRAAFGETSPVTYLRGVPDAQSDQQNDATLLAAIGRGDERALSALYDRHSPVVMGVAVRILGDTDIAETVLLDTFTQVWTNAARYDAGRASVVGWLVMMARSRALDVGRSVARRDRLGSVSVDDAPDEDLTAVDLSSNPGQMVEARERRSAILTALCALPDPQRIAVEMAFFDGLSQSEIADRLSEPLGTVKTRIRLAMNKLRQLLARHGDEALV